MYFQHSTEVWTEFPELVAGVVIADEISKDVNVGDHTIRFTEIAESRLANGPESEFPEIQAWRRTFSKMGLKPTQYRCASESLLRRFRKERSLPHIHPLIDLCNAISLAYATPIAVFDTARIEGGLTVRHATGTETYLTFSGETEHPGPREVVFADEADRAHARRWTNRQSRHSAVSDITSSVLIVAEAMHDTAPTDIPKLTTTIANELTAIWASTPEPTTLTANKPRLDFKH